jgi:hypothetical protein
MLEFDELKAVMNEALEKATKRSAAEHAGGVVSEQGAS